MLRDAYNALRHLWLEIDTKMVINAIISLLKYASKRCPKFRDMNLFEIPLR